MIFSSAEMTRSTSTFKTCIFYSIRRNSTKLPSAFIVSKYYFCNFYLITFTSLIACIYICSPYMYILLCRKKVMKCMKGGPFDIGFVDPNRVHEQVVKNKTGQTEDFLLRSLLRQQTKREILLPYNFS